MPMMHELLHKEDLGKTDDLFLCDPPFNIRCPQNLRNSDHDVFNAMDMNKICDFAEYHIMHVGYAFIICFAQ